MTAREAARGLSLSLLVQWRETLSVFKQAMKREGTNNSFKVPLSLSAGEAVCRTSLD